MISKATRVNYVESVGRIVGERAPIASFCRIFHRLRDHVHGNDLDVIAPSDESVQE